jgi:GAF domain-containing protein
VDAFLQDAQVASRDLAGEGRWPNFRPLALAAGIRAWLSVPVRHRHGPIGALDFARIEQACDLIMQRERLDEVAAVELLRLQAQIEDQPIRAVAGRLLSRPRR